MSQEFYPDRGLLYGTFALRPAAGVLNRYYYATDIFVLFRDTGVAWEKVGGKRYALYETGKLGPLGAFVTGAVTTGNVHLLPIEIGETVTIDALVIPVSNNVGNVRMCLYRDNGNVPDGGALIVETASVAPVGGNRKSEVAIANTQLIPGMYWFGFQCDNGALTLLRMGDLVNTSGTVEGKSYALVYGAFTDPCPATATDTSPAVGFLKVASIP